MDVNELIIKWHEKRKENAERFKRCFPESDDLMVIVLRGHLLVEEYIDNLNKHYFHYPKYYYKANFNFYNKLLLAKSLWLLPFPDRDMFFKPFEMLNSIRNDLAHNLESQNLNDKLLCFLSVVEKEYPKELLELYPIENSNVEKRARNAISSILGQLDVLDNVIEYMERTRVYGGKLEQGQ